MSSLASVSNISRVAAPAHQLAMAYSDDNTEKKMQFAEPSGRAQNYLQTRAALEAAQRKSDSNPIERVVRSLSSALSNALNKITQSSSQTKEGLPLII
jgi:hypothetical protein